MLISREASIAYRTAHLLEVQAVDDTGKLTYFLSSQVVTLLLLIGFLVFQLKKMGSTLRISVALYPASLSPVKTLILGMKSQTDLTVHQVSMLGPNNWNIALV